MVTPRKSKYARPHNPSVSACTALSTSKRAIAGVGPSNRATSINPLVGPSNPALVRAIKGIERRPGQPHPARQPRQARQLTVHRRAVAPELRLRTIRPVLAQLRILGNAQRKP